METLKLLQDYFPMAVYTGKCLVFISEEWRVELTEHKENDFSKEQNQTPIIRVRIAKRALNGDLLPSFNEDFQIEPIGQLAEQVEKFVQMAVGKNLKEM
jgi:hypothetical protein